jgi:hypothetical protein
MSDRRKPWDNRDRKHFRKIEKRRKKGKVVRALLPEIKDGFEEPYRPTTSE